MTRTDGSSTVIDRVRRALGRAAPLDRPPEPPEIPQPLVRLVHSEIGLPELFIRRAEKNHMHVQTVYAEHMADELATFLTTNSCRRIALQESPLLERLEVALALRQRGFDLSPSTTSSDALFDLDCGITDVWRAVAETGSLVIKTPDPAPGGGSRGLSLVPPIHVAVVEPKNLIPDLVDLFELLTHEPDFRNVILISGPSKTADIEMNLVTGVHGPGLVKVFVLG